MRTIKKITTWMLIAVMAGGAFSPVQGVEAKQSDSYRQTEMIRYGDNEGAEDSTASTEGSTEDSTASTEDSTEDSTTGNTTQTSSGEPATEVTTEGGESTTEIPATSEEPEETPTANPDVVASGLSPVNAKVIVLDPGHCGRHPGASGNGLREEVVVLDIAQACQDALNAYADVTVYMTREDSGCPSTNGLGDDLVSRNNYAKILDADFLVSMHINAGKSSGANVLTAYQSGYHDNIRKETQAFGKVALSKLKDIGIANRGLLLRKSGTGNRYSNGKLADYYSIVRHGVIQNIPSVIIEHGYITSSSDCSKFFKTKSKRKTVGKADAGAIVSYYNLKQKVMKGTFKKEDGDSYYITSDNKKAGGWVKNDGKWYYFDELSGKMQSGFVTIGEETFYLSPSTGEMMVGWFTVDGSKYLAKGNGAIVKNQIYSDGRYTYLFGSTGKQAKKGFRQLDGATYYVDSKKHVVTGFKKISGNKYYFSPSTGKMLTGWRKISGKYYYFSKTSGKMQKSKWIGKYYVNKNGIRTKKK